MLNLCKKEDGKNVFSFEPGPIFAQIVLADEINENLYDTFGDPVIEMEDDDTPVLIEDYLDYLKGMLET